MLPSIVISGAALLGCLLYPLLRWARFAGRLRGRVIAADRDGCTIQVLGEQVRVVDRSAPLGAWLAVSGTHELQQRLCSYREPALGWMLRSARVERVWPRFRLLWLAAAVSLALLGGAAWMQVAGAALVDRSRREAEQAEWKAFWCEVAGRRWVENVRAQESMPFGPRRVPPALPASLASCNGPPELLEMYPAPWWRRKVELSPIR